MRNSLRLYTIALDARMRGSGFGERVGWGAGLSAELRSERGPAEHTGILERLRHLILIGDYGPDERLVEEQLARRLGVSRTPVRQALAMLEAEGLVEISPNRGATVCSFGLDDVWDIYDLRAVLEGHAARRAAGRIEWAELKRLRKVVGEMEGLPGRFDDHEEEIRA